ncbi:MAG TPA: phage antirepressor N-terminal domain-containing protein [Ktedonobacterales bacterium]|nr:phage antirepressor N-terminal domain-containing protein [Ktedonobacterales bacterium]
MGEEMLRKAATILMPSGEQSVNFYGDTIVVAFVEGIPYVALRTFTDYLGLDWSAQRQRTERDEVLVEEVKPIIMTGADGRQREMLGLPLEYLPGWLFGISPSRVRPELREKVTRYRRSCFKVLWDAVQTELLQRQALMLAVDPHTREIAEQIDTLTGVVNLLREHLASLLVLPGQVNVLGDQMQQAISFLESLAGRQEEQDEQIAQIDERTQRLTPAHTRAVKDWIDEMVRQTARLAMPLTYSVISGAGWCSA